MIPSDVTVYCRDVYFAVITWAAARLTSLDMSELTMGDVTSLLLDGETITTIAFYCLDSVINDISLWTDFTDTRTALCFFSLFQFFSSFQLSLFPSVLVFFFCLRSVISPITACFLIFVFFLLF